MKSKVLLPPSFLGMAPFIFFAAQDVVPLVLAILYLNYPEEVLFTIGKGAAPLY